MLQASKKKSQDELAALKADLHLKSEEINKVKEEMKKLVAHAEIDKENLKREMNERARLEKKVSDMNKELKVGGNVGIDGVSYDQLMARNRDLEQEVRVL